MFTKRAGKDEEEQSRNYGNWIIRGPWWVVPYPGFFISTVVGLAEDFPKVVPMIEKFGRITAGLGFRE